jgi:predicted 3-demethylubiquinone-9 3-methyltransferase (glyoxalase superfamily)
VTPKVRLWHAAIRARVWILNGGPEFKFSEAISLVVSRKNQEEVDAFWSELFEGGEEGPLRLADHRSSRR